MHGILAMGATHLSRLCPSRQAHYVTLAARNHDTALPGFQSALENINPENCHALILYSKSLLWCSLASDVSSKETKIELGTDKWLPQWFYLLRGSCHIAEFFRTMTKDWSHGVHRTNSVFDYSKSPDDEQITALTSQLLLVTQSASCEIVLTALRQAFARAYQHNDNTPFRDAINFWIASLPETYIQSVQKKEPWALVVLAHFCVLFHRSEKVWFMKGHATRLLLSIIEFLDTSWRRFVEWPCQELGIE